MTTTARATAARAATTTAARRALLAVACTALVAPTLAACKGDGERQAGAPSSSPGAAPPADTAAKVARQAAWPASCGAALSGLGAVAAERRVATILAACPVCEMAPILVERQDLKRTAAYLPKLDTAVAGCGGFCTKLSRTAFLRLIQHQLDSRAVSAKPWRELAETCPTELGWRDDSRGFVGATWFLLERVAAAAAAAPSLAEPLAAAARAPFPLPAVAAEGRGLSLPEAPAAATLVQPGRLVVTVLVDGAMVGRLPWAQLTAGGVQVDGVYPGVRIGDDPKDGKGAKLTAALATAEAALVQAAIAAEPDHAALPVTLIAPPALPARRVAALLRQLGRPARLAVRPSASSPAALPDYRPPMTLAAVLVGAPAAAAARSISLADTAALTAAAAAPASAEGQAAPISLVLGAEATVEELVAALALLRAAPSVALVER